VGLVPTLSIAVFFIDHLITYMGWSKAQHLEVAAGGGGEPSGRDVVLFRMSDEDAPRGRSERRGTRDELLVGRVLAGVQ
jgi:hypothetical protein